MKKIIIALLFMSASFAQEKETNSTEESRVIKVYQPNASTVDTSEEAYKWAVKTDIGAFLGGEFPIIGEYRFAEKFSAEASAGLTYSFWGNDGLADLTDDVDGSVEDSEAAMGTAFRAAVKYFPSADYDAIEGWYFGIQLYNRVNKRNYIDNGQSNFNGGEDIAKKTGISLIIGKQIFADSNIAWDWYVGVGIAKKNRTQTVYNYDSNLGENVYSELTTDKTQPNVNIGLRIGFGN